MLGRASPRFLVITPRWSAARRGLAMQYLPADAYLPDRASKPEGVRLFRFFTVLRSLSYDQSMLRRLLHTSAGWELTIVRVALGIVMLPHGIQKTLGWFGGAGFHATMGFFTQGGIPAVFAFLAICAEFLGGLGLIVGLLARIAAFGVFCNMLVAVFTVHWQNGLFMNWAGNQKGEGFEFHILAIGMAIAVMLRGAGKFSLDRALSGGG
jgi:putative oxidoreductase